MSDVVPLRTVIANRIGRTLSSIAPGFFPEQKHDHYGDFGFKAQLTFTDFYAKWSRDGFAAAAIEKTILKTWQTFPELLETESSEPETALELQIRDRFTDLRFWQRLAEVDRRSMVGAYAGAILRFGDGKPFSEPVDRVPGGLLGLVEIVPAWQAQLEVSAWDTDERSPGYGSPTMYRFNEAAVTRNDGSPQQPRAFTLHPDRVVIWSRDGTLWGHSTLSPGFNDLYSMEKIRGAGGEGFWKNAKSAPVISTDGTTDLKKLADAMKVPMTELMDALGDQVEDWQKGFDKLLFMHGMKANTLGVTLPSPEHFHGVNLQAFAASMGIPTKVLIGEQTGERASTEDAREWAQTNMARRNTSVIPNIRLVVQRLEAAGILPEKDWRVEWADLTEASADEKIARAAKMTEANSTSLATTSEFVYTWDEIRQTAGYEPLTPAEAKAKVLAPDDGSEDDAEDEE
jgi:hypothetical protein